MNLLFSFGNLIRPTKGGTERVTSLISNGLRARGHRVFFLITEENITKSLPAGNYSCAGLSMEGKAEFVNKLCATLSIDAIINEAGTSDDVLFLNHERITHPCRIITCIHFDITGDLRYFYRCQAGPIRSVRDIIRRLRMPWLKWINTRSRRRRYRYLLLQSDAVVVPAPALVEQFFRFIGQHPDSRLHCIPNPSLFAPETVHRKENLALYIGRLSPEKHVNHLLKAWAESGAEQTDWQLIIAGDGSLRSQLEEQMRKLRLKSVRFLGNVQEPAALYRKAALLVLPSDYESFSMVVLEGLSFACFPIVYEFPALSQLLAKPDWGISLPQHHPHTLAMALRKAITEKLTNLPHQKDIHTHLKHFALPIILNQWEQLIAPAP